MARASNTSAPHALDLRVAWLALFLCLALSAAATSVVAYEERLAARARFGTTVVAARERIAARMAAYVALLRGSAGFFSRTQPMTAADFRMFVERAKLADHYPGTLGIGYSHRFGNVSPADATASAHHFGWTHIRVWPEEPRDEVHAIVLIEPLDARNRAALGYDMRSEDTRREAMDRGRDQGTAALSGKVTLVQEIDEAKQPGFLLYLPTYEGGKVPVALEDRRAKLKGYVYAPLRANDLFRGILGSDLSTVAVEVYDGDRVNPAKFLFGAGTPKDDFRDAHVEQLSIAGRIWTARFDRDRGAKTPFPLALDVAALGGVLSFMVFLGVRAREEARVRELRAAASELASKEMVRFTELFIGILGHDLRNPLSAISLAAQNLAKRHSADAETSKALTRILSSTQRMTRMIEQLLDVTRTRLGGGMPLTTKPCDLGAVARDTVDEIYRARPDCKITLDDVGDLQGTWDEDRMAQVFSNVVGNAVQYCAGAAVHVELSGAAPERVVAKVHNGGVIPPALLPVLFEPFRRGDSASRSSGGLGLGLYISRSIVEAHGGTISVTSTDREGTTFTIKLPRTPPITGG